MGGGPCKIILCSESNAQAAMNLATLGRLALEEYVKISPELVAQIIEAQDKQEKKNAALALAVLKENGFPE